jgi:hypothetical protein
MSKAISTSIYVNSVNIVYMATHYTKITEGRRARVHNGYLEVEQTNMYHGMLEQGGYVGRTYQIPYTGTLEEAMIANEQGITDIDRCIESNRIIHAGRVIR